MRTETILLKAYNRSTAHYLKLKCAKILWNLKPTTTRPVVHLPNNYTICKALQINVPIMNVPSVSTEAHLFIEIKGASIFSFGQICDKNCTSVFTKDDIKVLYSNKYVILQGARKHDDGIWGIKLSASK